MTINYGKSRLKASLSSYVLCIGLLMNRLLNLILASSTMLMAFLDKTPATAKDCPQLNRNIITVLSDDAMLRVYPDDRASKVPPIFKGDELKINHNRGAKIVNQRCFYPVMINNFTYWIPDNQIKEYNISYGISDNKRLVRQVQIPTKKRGIFSWQSLPFEAITNLILIGSVLSLLSLQLKINFSLNKFNKLKEGLNKIIIKNEKVLYENLELLNLSDNLLKENTRISKSILQDQKNLINNLQLLYKNFEVSVPLDYSCHSRDNERTTPPPIPRPLVYDKPLPPEPPLPLVSPPPLMIPSELPTSSSLEVKNILDSFYGIVIDKFNNADHAWFRSRIQDGIFRNATITKSSIIETINPIKVELSTNGTLLLYHAADKICLIPDLTQPSWTRTITSSLFINTGEILNLKRAVELTSDTKNSWLLVKRGEFQA